MAKILPDAAVGRAVRNISQPKADEVKTQHKCRTSPERESERASEISAACHRQTRVDEIRQSSGDSLTSETSAGWIPNLLDLRDPSLAFTHSLLKTNSICLDLDLLRLEVAISSPKEWNVYRIEHWVAVSVALYVFLSMQNRLRGGSLPCTTRHHQELAGQGQRHSLHLDLNHCYLWSDCKAICRFTFNPTCWSFVDKSWDKSRVHTINQSSYKNKSLISDRIPVHDMIYICVCRWLHYER